MTRKTNKNKKHLTCHKSKSTILRDLCKLRKLIDNNPNFIEKRIAYAMETAVRWTIEETSNWKGLAEEACLEADILKKELTENKKFLITLISNS